MTVETNRGSISPAKLALIGVPLLLIGAAGGWLWHSAQSNPGAGLGSGNKAAMEKVVHDYLMENPEVLPKAMAVLQGRETAKQLAGIREGLEKPYAGAVMGNPAGTITLVEFTDFGCTYCRQSVADVAALVRANPDLRVVVREFPILNAQSVDASRMALAAAEQGKYPAFHDAMFAAGRPDPATIEAAAKAAGVDLAKARAVLSDPRIEAELARNMDFARQLGFNGTPSWVVGNQVLTGAVGIERMQEAITAARS